MNELNITGICANTSSAKGRVERAHLTLQDRLVKELRLRGISTPEAANAFADEFMEGVRLENGIYGHSRFCNTDFDDKLACLNLSGV